MPATLEERVAYLEGKVEEHSYAWRDLKEAIRETNDRLTHLEQKFDQRFAQIDQRITNMEQKFEERFAQIDQRFAQIEERFAQIDQRFVQIDQRFAQIDQRFVQIDQRIAQIDQRIDKIFFFILATLASSIGALISALLSIFVR